MVTVGETGAEGGAANSFVRLIDAIRAELSALDGEDAAGIEAATATKLAALQAVQADIAAGAPPQKALLEQARELPTGCSATDQRCDLVRREAAEVVTVDRRLAAVSAAAGRPAALVYGRDGRWA